jgi:hypothetical protein
VSSVEGSGGLSSSHINIDALVSSIESQAETQSDLSPIYQEVDRLEKRILLGTDEYPDELLGKCLIHISKVKRIAYNDDLFELLDLLEKVENLVHCGKIFNLTKKESFEEAELTREFDSIDDLKLKTEALEIIKKNKGGAFSHISKETELKFTIEVNQGRIIGVLMTYMEMRGASQDVVCVFSEGACNGLSLLNLYYQFIGQRDVFIERIEKIISYIQKSRPRHIADIPYKDLDEIIYLQDVYRLTSQRFPAKVLASVSDNEKIKNLSSQFHLADVFSKDDNGAYVTLGETIQTLVTTDPDKEKALVITTGDHAINVFYENNQCYFYNPNSPILKRSQPIDMRDPGGAAKLAKELTDSIFESVKSPSGESISLTIEVISNEKLIGMPKFEDILLYNPTEVTKTYNESGPLMAAVSQGWVDVVRLLLTRGADVNLTSGEYGTLPLIIACQKNDVEMVNLLLDNGALVDKMTNKNVNALAFCISSRNLDMCQVLLERGADVGLAVTTILSFRDTLGIDFLLSTGFPIELMVNQIENIREYPNMPSGDEFGPAMFRLLLERGADRNQIILMLIKSNNEKGIEFLLNMDNQITKDTKVNNKTLIELAREMGSNNVVDFLLKQR